MIRIAQKISYARFRKSEFRNLVIEILAVVDKFDPTVMFIKTMFDRLASAGDQLSALHVRYGSHPQTKELLVVRQKGNNLVKSIVGQVKTLQTANLDTQADSLALVASFVNRYLRPIVKSDWIEKTDYLNEMFKNLNGDDSLKVAIEELSMKVYFDELKTFLENQETIKQIRSTSIMERQKSNTPEVRALATTALVELFSAIELAQIEHPEIDFTQMINGINEKLSYYSAQIKTRITINKKAAESTPTTAGNPNSVKAA